MFWLIGVGVRLECRRNYSQRASSAYACGIGRRFVDGFAAVLGRQRRLASADFFVVRVFSSSIFL